MYGFMRIPDYVVLFLGTCGLNKERRLNMEKVGLSCVHSVNCLRKSIESHHMRTMCQRFFWSCLIYFLGTVSTAYFSLLLAIAGCSTYLLPDHSPIDIATDTWSFPHHYNYWYRLVHLSSWGGPQSHPETKTFSPTEMPHDRHEQGGIGGKWQKGCGTSSGREMQTLLNCFHPFHHHHP